MHRRVPLHDVTSFANFLDPGLQERGIFMCPQYKKCRATFVWKNSVTSQNVYSGALMRTVLPVPKSSRITNKPCVQNAEPHANKFLSNLRSDGIDSIQV
jgi:hypothetical protein